MRFGADFQTHSTFHLFTRRTILCDSMPFHTIRNDYAYKLYRTGVCLVALAVVVIIKSSVKIGSQSRRYGCFAYQSANGTYKTKEHGWTTNNKTKIKTAGIYIVWVDRLYFIKPKYYSKHVCSIHLKAWILCS